MPLAVAPSSSVALQRLSTPQLVALRQEQATLSSQIEALQLARAQAASEVASEAAASAAVSVSASPLVSAVAALWPGSSAGGFVAGSGDAPPLPPLPPLDLRGAAAAAAAAAAASPLLSGFAGGTAPMPALPGSPLHLAQSAGGIFLLQALAAQQQVAAAEVAAAAAAAAGSAVHGDRQTSAASAPLFSALPVTSRPAQPTIPVSAAAAAESIATAVEPAVPGSDDREHASAERDDGEDASAQSLEDALDVAMLDLPISAHERQRLVRRLVGETFPSGFAAAAAAADATTRDAAAERAEPGAAGFAENVPQAEAVPPQAAAAAAADAAPQPQPPQPPPPPPPPGWRRFIDISLLIRLAIMGALFFHSGPPERTALAAVALTFFYVARVGLLSAIVAEVDACARSAGACLCRRRGVADAAGQGAGVGANAGAAGNGVELPPMHRHGVGGGGGDVAAAAAGPGAAAFGEGRFLTPPLLMGRGYLLCDLLAAFVGLFVSLWPMWTPEGQLLGLEQPPADPDDD